MNITSLDLRTALPNGTWQGSGKTSSAGGVESASEMTLIIENNQITEDFFTNGASKVAIHKLKYVITGQPEWQDGQGRTLGDCQCFSKSCHCQTDDGRGTKHQMSLSFTERELNLEKSGEVNFVKYHDLYTLRIK